MQAEEKTPEQAIHLQAEKKIPDKLNRMEKGGHPS